MADEMNKNTEMNENTVNNSNMNENESASYGASSYANGYDFTQAKETETGTYGTYEYSSGSGTYNYTEGEPHKNRWFRRHNKNRNGNNNKDKKSGFGRKAAKFTAVALSFGLIAGCAFAGSSYALGNYLGSSSSSGASSSALKTTNTSYTSSSDSSSQSSTSTVVSEVMPSIVAITNLSVSQYNNYFMSGQPYESESAGSGIIVSEDDDYVYIVTNNHVVEDATTLTVQFSDDSTVEAQIQGTDADDDLAVVKVAKSDISDSTLNTIKVATLGDSDSLSVGDDVIAIGNALGYGQSVTTGVVSALNRQVEAEDESTGTTTTTSGLIQTDAAINPGNSGGALLDSDGNVIGINSSKFSSTSVEGMGFAIPINTAKSVISDLIKNGTTSSTTSVSDDTGSSSGSDSQQGGYSYEIPGYGQIF